MIKATMPSVPPTRWSAVYHQQIEQGWRGKGFGQASRPHLHRHGSIGSPWIWKISTQPRSIHSRILPCRLADRHGRGNWGSRRWTMPLGTEDRASVLSAVIWSLLAAEPDEEPSQ